MVFPPAAKPAEDSPSASPEEHTAFDNFSYQSPSYARKMHHPASLAEGNSGPGSLGRAGTP